MTKLNLLPGGTQAAPVYVTRPSGPNNESGVYQFSIGWTLVVMALLYTNAILWGTYGAIQAVLHIATLALS